MAILGFSGALGNIALDTHLMQNASQEMLGRVTSTSRLASFSACAIGPIMGGILVQEYGAQLAMFFLFIFTPIPLLLAAFNLPASRHQRSAQAEPGASGSDSPNRDETGPADADPPRTHLKLRRWIPGLDGQLEQRSTRTWPDPSIFMAASGITDGEPSNFSADLT